MPTYTFQRKVVAAERAEAYDALRMFFDHAEGLGLDLSDLTFTKTGGAKGTVTVTVVQAIPADQLAHLGLG